MSLFFMLLYIYGSLLIEINHFEVYKSKHKASKSVNLTNAVINVKVWMVRYLLLNHARRAARVSMTFYTGYVPRE